MRTNIVIHGDSLEYMKSLPDKCIDLILTDPPFGMSFVSKRRHETTKHKAIANDDNLDWLEDFIKETARVLKEDSHAYIFCSMHFVDEFVSTVKNHLPYKNILVWEKNNTGMGDLEGDYAPKYEFCIFCNGDGSKKLNGGRDPNIMKFAKTGNDLHPTQKPVDMFSYLIDKSTQPGDIVLDCFAGSGTTAVACIELGRKYIVIEKDEYYVDIIHKRIRNTTPPLFI